MMLLLNCKCIDFNITISFFSLNCFVITIYIFKSVKSIDSINDIHFFQFRLNELNALSSMNEILQDIADRINDNSLSATLSDLLVIYNVNKDVNEEIQTIVDGNLQWLNAHSSDIQDFLNDFHSSTSLSTTSTVVWYLVVIIFGFLH